MKRLATLLLAFVFLTALPAEAQPNWRHQATFNAGPQFVTGDQSDAFKTGLAIDVAYYYRASNAGFVGLATGLHQFKGDAAAAADIDIIPLHAALKYNFSLTGIQPYVGGQGGLSIVNNGDSETKFGVAPRLGLRIPLAEGIDLDLNLTYNVIFDDPDNLTYVGANGGFSYILGR